MDTKQTAQLHPSETSAYWLAAAANERAWAKRPYKTVDSIRIHTREAEMYEKEAARLQALGQ